MSSKLVSIKTYFLVWIGLLILLLLTWGISNFDLGSFSIVVALAIALTKTLLVMLFFMHVRYSSRMVWVFAGAGFLWLLIMITLTMSDYVTRGSVRPYNKTPSESRTQMRGPAYQEKETSQSK